jgi:hypothetical protein
MGKVFARAALAAGVAAVLAMPVAAQQPVATGPSRPGDMDLTCPGLAMEMARAAQAMGQAPAAPVAPAAQATAPAALAGMASAIGTSQLEQVGRAYQQAQNAQQLANMQVLAARGGVSRGTATAAIGGLAALQQVAANGGNAGEAARSVAADAVTSQLASRIPGGALIGGVLGGMFKKKPKPVAVVAAPAAVVADGGARERLAFLGAIMQAKSCK